MPSSITHAYIAMDVYDNLDKNIQKKLLNKLENYKTYSQGPDVFYFYHILFHNNIFHYLNCRLLSICPCIFNILITKTAKVSVLLTFSLRCC